MVIEHSNFQDYSLICNMTKLGEDVELRQIKFTDQIIQSYVKK